MTAFLRRVPLRTKLVAAVLALITASLLAIGVISSIALRRYLIGRIDSQLIDTSRSLDIGSIPQSPVHSFIPPTAWLVALTSVNGVGFIFPQSLSKAEQPILPSGIQQAMRVSGVPYTVESTDGSRSWRLLVTRLPDGGLFILGQSLTDVDGAVNRLIAIELVVGAATLIVISAVGFAVVRASLRPLTEMESTAAAITAGDFTRRVPESEPGEAVPRTEVGTLGRSLNTMLAQIESALRARARSEAVAQGAAVAARDSEAAARDSEVVARIAAEAAQRSEARARRSEERMRQFAADASHELRTPLTTIRGFAELYRQGAAREPEETARLLRRIEDEASRMGLLVDDLLLLARLDQERPLEHLPVDLRVVANDAVVNAKAVAPDRQIGVGVAPGTGPLVVIGDDLRLRQVVANLMTNALTYTPAEAPITVRLAAEHHPVTGDGVAVLSVIDTGPGLSPDHTERVFERFYRGDAARSRRADGGHPSGGHPSGTGLGLAIVAALVGAHGGTVEVATTPGHGATFHVRLPLAPLEPDESDEPE